MGHFVYMVRCLDDSLYTGYAVDVEKRLKEHNGDATPSAAFARYTRSRRPVRLVYKEECASRSEALSREYRIKQLSKIEKEALVASYR